MEDKTPVDLRIRTVDFALKVVSLYTSLPKTTEAQVLGKQVLRSGTSIGAHYREGHRAKSDADIVNKFETALQELVGIWLLSVGALVLAELAGQLALIATAFLALDVILRPGANAGTAFAKTVGAVRQVTACRSRSRWPMPRRCPSRTANSTWCCPRSV